MLARIRNLELRQPLNSIYLAENPDIGSGWAFLVQASPILGCSPNSCRLLSVSCHSPPADIPAAASLGHAQNRCIRSWWARGTPRGVALGYPAKETVEASLRRWSVAATKPPSCRCTGKLRERRGTWMGARANCRYQLIKSRNPISFAEMSGNILHANTQEESS